MKNRMYRIVERDILDGKAEKFFRISEIGGNKVKSKKKTLLEKLIEKKFEKDPFAEAPVKDKSKPIDKKRIKDGPPKEIPVVKPVIK